MSTQENAQIVKDAFAAVGRGNKQGLLALSAEDVEPCDLLEKYDFKSSD
jgi:hypothetical protein